jgi:hydrogenase expression/formation protein HypD
LPGRAVRIQYPLRINFIADQGGDVSAKKTDKERARELKVAIAAAAASIGGTVKLMEVCGTHTVALFRHGIRSLLPETISLLSGPGCPVCVTSVKDVDIALALAAREDAVLCTFGDMMRVPGGKGSLFDAKASGADVRIVYSPLDALKMATDEPSKKVVFFATGFETTSPLVAATVMNASREGTGNFYLHTVHKLVPPALDILLGSGEVDIDGFILPGHVCSITGTGPFEFLTGKYNKPSVVTGFGAIDILEGILMVLKGIAEGMDGVGIQYGSVVKAGGNPRAMETLSEVFEPADAYWRGIGSLPLSGLGLREPYAKMEASGKGGLIDIKEVPDHPEPRGCSCGEVLKGLKIPADCPLFGRTCTPQKPVGACMVSAEGSCAAYFKYGGHGAG